jgi:cytidylate kinase
MTGPVVIAVDGTAASGKGTLAQRLAKHFRFAHLDSGSLYRLTALKILSTNGDVRDERTAIAAARGIDPRDAARCELRGREIAEGASIVAAIPGVRAELLAFQQRFARELLADGAVIDGRDIGTVVCPDATAKLFVDAAPEVRARRRRLELEAQGEPVSEAAILSDIRTRDARDRNRAVAPLKPAPDADLLDTSNLDIDAAFAAALGLVSHKVEEALAARHRG